MSPLFFFFFVLYEIDDFLEWVELVSGAISKARAAEMEMAQSRSGGGRTSHRR